MERQPKMFVPIEAFPTHRETRFNGDDYCGVIPKSSIAKDLSKLFKLF